MLLRMINQLYVTEMYAEKKYLTDPRRYGQLDAVPENLSGSQKAHWRKERSEEEANQQQELSHRRTVLLEVGELSVGACALLKACVVSVGGCGIEPRCG